MIKMIGLVMVFTSASCIGINKAHKYKMRIRELDKLVHFATYMKIELKSNAYTLSELFKVIIKRHYYDEKSFSFIEVNDNNPSISIAKMIDENIYLSKSDKEIFISLLKQLGTTELESQLKIIEGNIMELEEVRKELLENEKQKCKLYSTFGILVGAFISILII